MPKLRKYEVTSTFKGKRMQTVMRATSSAIAKARYGTFQGEKIVSIKRVA